MYYFVQYHSFTLYNINISLFWMSNWMGFKNKLFIFIIKQYIFYYSILIYHSTFYTLVDFFLNMLIFFTFKMARFLFCLSFNGNSICSTKITRSVLRMVHKTLHSMFFKNYMSWYLKSLIIEIQRQKRIIHWIKREEIRIKIRCSNFSFQPALWNPLTTSSIFDWNILKNSKQLRNPIP